MYHLLPDRICDVICFGTLLELLHHALLNVLEIGSSEIIEKCAFSAMQIGLDLHS